MRDREKQEQQNDSLARRALTLHQQTFAECIDVFQPNNDDVAESAFRDENRDYYETFLRPLLITDQRLDEREAKTTPSSSFSALNSSLITEYSKTSLCLGKQCVCGYGNGHIKLWDLKQCSMVWQYDNSGEGDGASSSNNKCISMCLNDEQTLVASGSADGNCRVLNLSNGKLLSSFACFQPSSAKPSTSQQGDDDGDDDDDEGETATSIESVTFGAAHLLICGTLSGFIYIWDINTKLLRSTLNLQSGVVKCLLNEGHLLYTACLDGHIRLMDVRNGEPLKEWKSGGGQGCEIMDMVITKDKRHLLCAYMQGLCRVFKLKE